MNSGQSSRILFYVPCYAALAREVWEPAPTHPGKLRPILRSIGCAQRDVHTHRFALAALGADERLGPRSATAGTRAERARTG